MATGRVWLGCLLGAAYCRLNLKRSHRVDNGKSNLTSKLKLKTEALLDQVQIRLAGHSTISHVRVGLGIMERGLKQV